MEERSAGTGGGGGSPVRPADEPHGPAAPAVSAAEPAAAEPHHRGAPRPPAPAAEKKRKRACSHLASDSLSGGPGGSPLGHYRLVVRWSEQAKLRSLAKERSGEGGTSLRPPQCRTCGGIANTHICLFCAFPGCWEHARQHMQEKPTHLLAADFENQALFCNGCGDYVYDPEYEFARNDAQRAIRERPSAASRLGTPAVLGPAERGKAIQSACAGLRGLRNLGNTCFMNVILQAMVHNPLLRNHYLADRHNRALCGVAREKAGWKKPCIACEVDKLFSEVYSGEKKPFGPCSFLHSVWQCADELAGYKQHDAHEFFISVLNELHQNESPPNDTQKPSQVCRCIVHRTYAGTFQSDVTCLRCGNVTTAHDPFLDISLDMHPARKKRKGSNVAAVLLTGPPPSSLTACLDRYTQSEKLGSKDYTCTKCESPQEATKQLSFKALPPVLSFQLKRFEHHTGTSKIESQISFPESVNLGPYTSHGKAPNGSGGLPSAAPQPGTPESSLTLSSSSSPSSSDEPLASKTSAAHTGGKTGGVEKEIMYDLFAVVNHAGKADTGHYTAFVRNRCKWFRTDDHVIQMVQEEDVLKSQAYMLFYVKRQLDYSQTPG